MHAGIGSGNTEGKVGKRSHAFLKAHLSLQVSHGGFGIRSIFLSASAGAEFIHTFLRGRLGKSSSCYSKLTAKFYLLQEFFLAGRNLDVGLQRDASRHWR